MTESAQYWLTGAAAADRLGTVAACDLLVLGDLNPDVVVSCAGEVVFGQVEQLVERATVTLGGSGAITASAAAAQGLSVAFCGVVGADALGELTVDLLAAQGVDVTGVRRRDGRSTGMTVVLSRPDGDRAMLTFPGTIADLRGTDIDPGRLAGARHVHVSSIFLQRGLQHELPDLLRATTATTSLDPGWDPDEQWSAARDVLAELDYLLPNAAECTRIAEVDDPLDAARALHGRGPVIAVKLGADGAAVVGPDGVHTVAAERMMPVDTTGAGDNFDAGFLVALLDGADPDEALARGVASGSIAVLGWGGTGRHATRDEALAGAGRLGVRAEVVR